MATCSEHTRAAVRFKPCGIYAYFDALAVWLKESVDRQQIATLRRQCDGHLHVDNRPARFGRNYRQRIDCKQPADEFLRWLSERDDALINYIEAAVDYTFDRVNELEDTEAFLRWHQIRNWHGRRQDIRVVNGRTLYDAGRWAPNSIKRYGDKPCRVTGEIFCTHMEWRARGADAVRRIGIRSGTDLVNFDHRAFWEKRLVLVTVDPEKLGRAWRNARNGGRSRTALMEKNWNEEPENVDEWSGEVLLKGYASIQELVDTHPVVKRCLTRLPNDDWLPDRCASGELSSIQGVGSEWSRFEGISHREVSELEHD